MTKTIHYKQKSINLTTIGETLARVSISAMEILKRIEQEPLNTPDYIASREYKERKEIIKRSEERTK